MAYQGQFWILTTLLIIASCTTTPSLAERVAVIDLKALQERANGNDTAAMIKLAPIYRYGHLGVSRDVEASLTLLMRAAAAGSPEAKFEYASWLSVLPQSDPRRANAGDLLKQAARASHTPAMLALANHALKAKPSTPSPFGIRRNVSMGIALLKKCAELGEVYCYSRLAGIYASGNHVTRNLRLAADYARSAVEEIDETTLRSVSRSALMTLAAMYGEGIGVRQNSKKALELQHRAARLGSREAIRTLAVFYLNGIGVKRDPNRAVAYALASAFFRPSDNDLKSAFFKPFLPLIQLQLRALDLYHGRIDGRIGPATRRALNALMRSKWPAYATFDYLKIGYTRGFWGLYSGKQRHQLSYQNSDLTVLFLCPVNSTADINSNIADIAIISKDASLFPMLSLYFYESVEARSASSHGAVFDSVRAEVKQGRMGGTWSDCENQVFTHRAMKDLNAIFQKQPVAYMRLNANWRYSIPRPSDKTLFSDFLSMCRPATIQVCKARR